MIKVQIYGDLCPTEKNKEAFASGDGAFLYGDILNIAASADLRIANIECPLTDGGEKSVKNGPHYKAPPACVRGVKALGADVAGLSNNHIGDYCTQGVIDTINTCRKNGIATVGAGANIREASLPVTVKAKDKTIGVLAFSDMEFSIAGEDKAGGCPFDPLISPDHISRAGEKCDFLIVLYHSGIENYRYPSPQLQQRCRVMADKGAGAVICQHSHCVGSYEAYNGSLIVYGQGNFLFDTGSASEMWNTGVIIELSLRENDMEYRFIPTEMNGGCVGLCFDEKRERILQGLNQSREVAENPALLLEKWREFCASRAYLYDSYLLRHSKWSYRFNKLTGNLMGRLLMREKKALAIENIVACESHREVLLEILKNKHK